METTLVIFKPDSLQRGLVGKILSRFENKGLQIVGLKLMNIDLELAEIHYKDHKGKPFYEALVNFMTSSPVIVGLLRGNNAIAVCRKMMGATFGSNAESGTIRGDFGISNSFNLIHGSDSSEAACREMGLFFKEDECIEWDRGITNWIYDCSGKNPE